MRRTLMRAVLGGLAGTALMIFMMRFAAPMMLGHPMDIAAMLGNMLGGSWALGMTAHLMNGVVIFPLAYVFVARRFLPGRPFIRGILWGILLWLVAEAAVMPVAGAGFFSSKIGGVGAAAAAFMAHVAYGAVLGATAGAAAAEMPVQERSRAQ